MLKAPLVARLDPSTAAVSAPAALDRGPRAWQLGEAPLPVRPEFVIRGTSVCAAARRCSASVLCCAQKQLTQLHSLQHSDGRPPEHGLIPLGREHQLEVKANGILLAARRARWRTRRWRAAWCRRRCRTGSSGPRPWASRARSRSSSSPDAGALRCAHPDSQPHPNSPRAF